MYRLPLTPRVANTDEAATFYHRFNAKRNAWQADKRPYSRTFTPAQPAIMSVKPATNFSHGSIMMNNKTLEQTDSLYSYIADTSLRPPAAMLELLETTEKLQNAGLASPPLQAQFLSFLVRMLGAKRIIEVGVFTGVSSLWMADAAGPDSRIVACDVSEEYTSIGKPFWEKAGLTDRIDLRIAPADQTLQNLINAGEINSFDFCYIDADKPAYDGYYELVIQLLRPGGVIAFDNMLQHGRVIDPDAKDDQVNAIRALNSKLHQDKRVDVSFLPLCDGVYLVRKK